MPNDGSNDDELNGLMALFAQILGWMMAVWETNPGLCSFILQLALLLSMFLCISCCRRRSASSSHSVQVHVSSQGEVTVGVDQREPVRAPGTPGRFNQLSPAPQGMSPGTPARPINVGGSQSEAESDLVPFEDEPVALLQCLPCHEVPGRKLSPSRVRDQQQCQKGPVDCTIPGQALSHDRLH